MLKIYKTFLKGSWVYLRSIEDVICSHIWMRVFGRRKLEGTNKKEEEKGYMVLDGDLRWHYEMAKELIGLCLLCGRSHVDSIWLEKFTTTVIFEVGIGAKLFVVYNYLVANRDFENVVIFTTHVMMLGRNMTWFKTWYQWFSESKMPHVCVTVCSYGTPAFPISRTLCVEYL